jgi:hypothetical protein
MAQEMASDETPESNATIRDAQDIEKTAQEIPKGNVPTSPEPGEPQGSNWKKPLDFYMASLSLWLAVLLVSLDSTGLAVAIPVCSRYYSRASRRAVLSSF